MIVIVLIAVVVSVAILVEYVAARPDTFRVERSAVIEAPPEQVFTYLEDFRSFREWSPNKNSTPACRTPMAERRRERALCMNGTVEEKWARAAWRSPMYLCLTWWLSGSTS